MVISPALLMVAMLGAPDTLPRVTWHDNLQPVGATSGNTTTVAIEIKRGDWRPNGEHRAGTSILAFAERGKAATTPGPLLRVRLGTRMVVTVTNSSADTIAVHGLAARRGLDVLDSIVILPGRTESANFIADVEGTYFYWGARPGSDLESRVFDDAMLTGAFVIDPAAGPVPSDRILVIDVLMEREPGDSAIIEAGEVLSINGRPWPLTERLKHTVGDSVRWRVINASPRPHPMHLHGFYFRLDAAGDWSQDTIYNVRQRRMAVTENLLPGTTRQLTWSPDRAGGWLFHCHLSFHALMTSPLGTEWRGAEVMFMDAVFTTANEGVQHHVEKHMGGLMMLVQVSSPGPLPAAPLPARKIRIVVAATPDTAIFSRQYSYQQTDTPIGDATYMAGPAAPLLLQRGEPTAVTIVNATPDATSIHWHGIEIEAYSDGVVGVGGHPGMPTPPIMPGDSFVAHITAPRSGTFMYHTHIMDINQQGKGLAGPLLVVDDRLGYDASRERILLVQNQLVPTGLEVQLNRSREPPADTLVAGETYRLRMINITLGNPALVFQFLSDKAGSRWTTIAKDGFDLPPWQRHDAPTRLPVSIGETYDVLWQVFPSASGWLEIRGGVGNLVLRQRIEVIAPPGR